MVQTVLKRDGHIGGFCEEKIMAAIKKAMTTTEHNVVVDLFAGCVLEKVKDILEEVEKVLERNPKMRLQYMSTVRTKPLP